MLIKQLPFQLFLTVTFAIFGSFLPATVLSGLYTLGVLFKDLLMMFIPLVVWGYLMSALVAFDKKSVLLAVGLVLLTVASSFITALTAFLTLSKMSFTTCMTENAPDLSASGMKPCDPTVSKPADTVDGHCVCPALGLAVLRTSLCSSGLPSL